ncbi:uncharacterized protein RCC_09091 [Ramularia collo-cygni]|uniref:Uncharacterized protein n=1 Tax=Ramularia collo-cygni TaxID=112498 RepID=A0A2D3UZ91_9PEZI|nr:uncharacterized protein RCC_09091 [Ramularia collo-cygni]CZT23377.1 uncharacterized protein RCC_09091 [Ramularia collo-cygni]
MYTKPSKGKSKEALAFIKNVDWKSFTGEIKEHIRRKPGNTAMLVTQWTLLVLFPALITSPIASLFGCSKLGPVVDTAASAFESKYGTQVLFRILQSYGMNGWGVKAVNSVFSFGSVLVNGAASLSKSSGREILKTLLEYVYGSERLCSQNPRRNVTC